MNEALKKELIEWGIDWEDARDRFVGNEELMCSIILKFGDNHDMDKLGEALMRGDVKAAFDESHMLKGNTGNLSMNAIYHDFAELTEILRRGSLEGAMEVYEKIVPRYELLMDILRKYKASN